jgi:hypothetical protein
MAGFPGGCFLDPSAYKIALNLRPFSPRYFVLGGPDVTINDPAPNMGVSTTNCGADNHAPRDLGNVAMVIHDAGSGTDWGGDVGSCHTVIFNYYRSLITLTPPYQSGSRERYYGCAFHSGCSITTPPIGTGRATVRHFNSRILIT